MQVGLLGLGKMGKLIAEKMMADGHQLVVWNRSKETVDQYRLEKPDFIVNGSLTIARTIEEMRDAVRKPRLFWTMLPAGEATNTVLDQLNQIVEQGDLVIDGGNSHFKDTEKWFGTFEQKGVKFLGIGVSGGVHALENGCCLMAGGNRAAYDYVVPLLDSLAKPNGVHTYFGSGGAGHFVKMIHNGIEYGMMQALAEGFGVLSKSDYHVNMLDIANTWQRGSIVSSFLLQTVIDAQTKDPLLKEYDGKIAATGEAKWTIEEAKAKHIPVPVIEAAFEYRARSLYDKLISDTYTAKLVAAMRYEFGGHEKTASQQPTEGTPPETAK